MLDCAHPDTSSSGSFFLGRHDDECARAPCGDVGGSHVGFRGVCGRGRNLLVGCPDHTTDLSIARNVRLGGNRQFQFRIDLFNAFNTVVINNRQTILTYASPATPTTVTNNQYNADGTLNAQRRRPVDAGAGAATSAQALRTVQLQFRFMF